MGVGEGKEGYGEGEPERGGGGMRQSGGRGMKRKKIQREGREEGGDGEVELVRNNHLFLSNLSKHTPQGGASQVALVTNPAQLIADNLQLLDALAPSPIIPWICCFNQPSGLARTCELLRMLLICQPK